MVKLAVITLALTLAVSRFAARWMPEEMKKAARILSWMLAAYIVFSLGLGIIAYLRPAA